MGALVGIAAILVALALANGQGKAAPGTRTTATGFEPPMRKTPPLPEFVKKVVTDKAATRSDLSRAAAMAAEAGYPQLAAALVDRASMSEAARAIPSPWKDVPDGSWTKFVKIMAGERKPNEVSPRGFYGVFQIGVRRLCDLGVMRSPRSKNVRGERGLVRVWEGVWVMPQEQFLGSAAIQYKLFLRSMELYRSVIAEKYKQVIGLEIFPGRKATLSGLLAVAHQAGSEGLHKWLMDAEIRKKFPWVTAAFEQANGVF